MIGLIGGGANLATGIAKGIMAKAAHNKYAKKLAGINMEMPGAIKEAEAVRTNLAYGNMPGFENMLGETDASTASTMSEAKTVATSPSALLDALVKTDTAGSGIKRDIGVKNAMYEAEQQGNLSRFLSTIKAPAEQRIQQFEIDKQIGIAKEDMMGTKELMGGIEGGIGSAFSAFGSGKKLDFMSDRNEMLKKYWGVE